MKFRRQNFENNNFKNQVYCADFTSFYVAVVSLGFIFCLLCHVKYAVVNDVIIKLEKIPTYQEVHDHLVREAIFYYNNFSPENVRKQLHQVCTEQQFVARSVVPKNQDSCYIIFQDFSIDLPQSKTMINNIFSVVKDKILCECGSRLRLDPADVSGFTLVQRELSISH